jgi:integrase
MQQYELFMNSLRSQYTKRVYAIVFQKYIDFVGSNDVFCQGNPRLIEHKIIDFIVSLRDKGLGYSAITNYVKAILAFYKINDFVLNTDKVSKFIPEYRKIKKDRSYTHQEIHRLLDFADERLRVVIYILASTGIRIGALPFLRLRNLEDNKITVYEGTNEEYITFCTPECSDAIDAYLDMRKRYGEKLTKDSFLIREQFDIRDPPKKSKAVKPETLARKLYDLSTRSGIRDKELPICHGFRKFFTTQLVNARINPEIREMLLGHKIGLTGMYYKPTEEDMLSEYMKAVNNLTINDENRLKMKVETLQIEKSELEMLTADVAQLKKMMKRK